MKGLFDPRGFETHRLRTSALACLSVAFLDKKWHLADTRPHLPFLPMALQGPLLLPRDTSPVPSDPHARVTQTQETTPCIAHSPQIQGVWEAHQVKPRQLPPSSVEEANEAHMDSSFGAALARPSCSFLLSTAWACFSISVKDAFVSFWAPKLPFLAPSWNICKILFYPELNPVTAAVYSQIPGLPGL